MRRHKTPGCHPMFNWPGCTRHTVRFDTLHIVDHHGVASKALGSFFQEVCCDHELGRSKDACLQNINEQMRAFQREHGERNPCPPLVWSNIVNLPENTTFPELHGTLIKAATTKSLVTFAAHLAATLNDGSEYKKRRAKMLQHLLNFNNLIGDAPVFLSDPQKSQLRVCVFGFLANYSWLARSCALLGIMRWHIVPKFHYFAHFPAQADIVNLRDTRCYVEESTVGRFAKVFRNSACGPYHNTVQCVVLMKYLLGLQIRFGMDLA